MQYAKVFGVPGTLASVRGKTTWFEQTWVSEIRATDYVPNAQMQARVRYDDRHGNGHDELAVTADITVGGQQIAGGCLHDEIAKTFPELQPLLQWHLMSSAGPMHYPGNAVFLAGDRDCWGRRAGEPSAYEFGIRVNRSPITLRLRKPFWEWLNEHLDVQLEPVPVAHDKPEVFTPNFTVQVSEAEWGYSAKWHECPFSDLAAVSEFCQAWNTCEIEFVKVVAAHSQGKARELDAARAAAIWPDATDAELSVEPEELRRVLAARLPGLVTEFRRTIEAAGLQWSPNAEA